MLLESNRAARRVMFDDPAANHWLAGIEPAETRSEGWAWPDRPPWPDPCLLTVTTASLPVLLASLLLVCGLLLGPGPAAASLLHLEGPVPADLGVRDGRLSPCASPAHCAEASWPVADPEAALAQLLPAVLALDGVEVVVSSAGYLHATATSRIFGFVDDLELHAGDGVIEARSVSRLGDSDLGVNARRLETLRRSLPAD